MNGETPKCEACSLEAWLNDPDTDLSAAQPPVLYHVCNKRGPKTKYRIFKQIEKVAKRMYDPNRWPGAVFDAERELEGLLWRLSGHDI